MFNNRVGHNPLPPGAGGPGPGGGPMRQGGLNPMHYTQQGMDSMMNGYSQPQGYNRPGSGGVGGGGVPGGHPGAGGGMGRSYPGQGYHHPTHAHLSQQSLQRKEQERRKRKAMMTATTEKKPEYTEDLFAAPIKITEPATPGINADKVLGNHKSFISNAAYNTNHFVGVDYQPPTPAPVQQNDDDEEVKPVRKPPAMGKPPQNNTRLPSNMENPRPPNKPRPVQHHQPPPQHAAAWAANSATQMAPPMALPTHRMNGGSSSSFRPPPPAALSNTHIAPTGGVVNPPPRISIQPSGSTGLNRPQRPPKLSLNVGKEDDQVQQILGVMLGDLPTPLTAIVTPQVEKSEDRGVQQHKARYLGASDPDKFFSALSDLTSGGGIGGLGAPINLLSRLSESDSDKDTGGPEDTASSSTPEPPVQPTTAPQKPLPDKLDPTSDVALIGRMSDTSSSESSSDSEEESDKEASEEEVRPVMSSGGRSEGGGPGGGKLGSSMSGGPASMEKPNLSEEESDDDTNQRRDYSLGNFINKAHDRTPPTTSSVHSNHTLEPSPRTYQPTPSPSNPSPRNQQMGGSGLITSILSHSPRTLSGVGHLTASPRTLGTSPRSSFMPSLSAAALGSATNGGMSNADNDHLQSPLVSPRIPQHHSPLNVANNLRHISPEITNHINDIMKVNDIQPIAPFSSDEELPLERTKPSATVPTPKLKTKASNKSYHSRSLPPEKKPLPESKQARKNARKRKYESSSNLVKNSEDSDDSDHAASAPPPSKKKTGVKGGRVTRAASSSPMKVGGVNQSSGNSSAGRTPSPRKPGSGHSTPAHSASRRTPNARSKAVSQPALSESDDDEIDSPPPASQKVNSGNGNQKKNQALFAMFGRKAAKAKGGGKGKGGKGKGGIDFIVGESDEEERKRGSTTAAQAGGGASTTPTSITTTSDNNLASGISSHIPSVNIKQEPLDLANPIIHADNKHHQEVSDSLAGGVGDIVDDDLALSEEDDDLPPPLHHQQQHTPSRRSAGLVASPLSSTQQQPLLTSSRMTQQRPLSQQQQFVVARKPNGRPSLVCSIQLSRVARNFGDPRKSSHSQKDDSRRGGDNWANGDNRHCDNNYGDSRSSHSERVDACNRMELPERPASARSSSREHRGSSSEHRKAQERTISQFAPSSTSLHEDAEMAAGGGSDRNRHMDGTKSSPGYGNGSGREWDKRSSRLQGASSSRSGGDVDDFGGPPHHATGGGSASWPQHSTSYMNGSGGSVADGDGLMPPPRFNGYVNDSASRRMEVEETDIETIETGMMEACRLKREADNEENVEAKCTKYLKAFLMFCHSAMRTEKEGDPQAAFKIYSQTLRMIKFVLKPIIPKKQAWPPKESTDIRLLVMSLRAQSLLNLKMYKLNRHVLKDLQKQINEVLVKADKDDETQQGGEPGGHLSSPTPSPAGSEGSNCSKSSGYTSSGEKEMSLLVPKTTLQNQYNIASYLSQCHELWEQAELFLNKGNCEDFFRRLDGECGPLTLHSDLCKLTNYTERGLDWISQEYSSLQRSPVTQHRNS